MVLSPRLQPDVGDLRKGDLRAAGGGQHQIAEGLRAVAGVLREPHRDVVGAVGHIDLADRRAANPGLDQVGDVGDVDAVAGRRCAVDVDGDLRNRRLLEDGGAPRCRGCRAAP